MYSNKYMLWVTTNHWELQVREKLHTSEKSPARFGPGFVADTSDASKVKSTRAAGKGMEVGGTMFMRKVSGMWAG